YLYFMGKKGDLNFSFNDELNPDSCFQLNLIANDIRIVADQEYDIPLLLDRDINLDGIQLSIVENSSIHAGSLFTSNTINNFIGQSQLHNANSKVCVTWIQSDSLPLNSPFMGKQDKELCTLHFKSKIDGYLHDILNLSGVNDNMLIENLSGQKYTITLFYRNFHLNNKNLSKNNGYTVAPNPASDYIRIMNSGSNDIMEKQFEYSLYTITGELIEKANKTGSELKISELAQGVYVLKLLFNKSQPQVIIKFIKI
ncbi:MAG: T9SS type A sorting domain-containing protein, partial [Saprospiraceae bacterium]